MYDFELLSKKCKLYYFKKIFSITLLITLIVGIGSYLFFHFSTKETPKSTKTITSKQHTKSVKNTKTAKTIKKIAPKKKEHPKQNTNVCYALQFFVSKKNKTHYLTLNKKRLTAFGFDCYVHEGSELLHLLCNKTSDYDAFLAAKQLAKQHNLSYVVKKRACVEKNIPQTLTKETKATKPPKKVKEVESSNNGYFLQTETSNLTTLKQLFNERKSYYLALKIAKQYYAMQDYNKAIIWAKKANNINKADDASWIIYAKSLYAKKEYKKAKKILQIYTKFENSSNVNKLLSKWSDK